MSSEMSSSSIAHLGSSVAQESHKCSCAFAAFLAARRSAMSSRCSAHRSAVWGVPELQLLTFFLRVARVPLRHHALVGLRDEALDRAVAVVAAVLVGDKARRRRPGLRLLRVADARVVELRARAASTAVLYDPRLTRSSLERISAENEPLGRARTPR